MKPYRSVNLPTILILEIEELLKKQVMYTTKASFIEDAVRRHIEKIKNQLIEEQKMRDYFEIRKP